MVQIEEGTIKGLNGINVEIQTDDLIAFRDRGKITRLDDVKELVSLEN
ncbi:unnamed protein product [marine sediment metagenome]|uniref:Uncharacterized protein n=1 Tax=marine sediment metagenome TaxID=412755 RepID=X1GR37_9ZZZZ